MVKVDNILNSTSYLHLFSPIISLGINVSSQVLISRYVDRIGLLKSIFVGFAMGAITLLIIELCSLDYISSFVVNLLIYSALGYCYFHFVNLGETARRIRLLRELAGLENGLSEEEILQRYNAEEIVTKRLGRLIKNGQIICKNNCYYIGKPLMLFISKLIVSMKILILSKRSEFD